MKQKLFLLLMALLLTAGTRIAKANPITSTSQLSNSKAYTIHTERGYWYVDGTGKLCTSQSTTAPDPIPDTYKFAILYENESYYIYSLGAEGMLRRYDDFGRFDSDMGNAVAFNVDNNGDYHFVAKLKYPQQNNSMGEPLYINDPNDGTIIINNYHTPDAGNRLCIEEVADFDPTNALAFFTTDKKFDSHKVYTVTGARSNWAASSDHNSLSTTAKNTSATDAEKQFAVLKIEKKYYIYNVGANKFLKNDGSLYDGKGDPMEYFIRPNDGNVAFYFEDNGVFLNMQNDGSYALNGYNGVDDGNAMSFNEVNKDVYDDAIATFYGPRTITYNIKIGGTTIATESHEQRVGDAAVELATKDFVTYTSYSPTTIAVGTTSVDVTAEWTGPFEFSTDFAHAHWYNLTIGSQGRYVCYEPNREPYIPHAFDAASAAAGGCGKAESAHYATDIVRASDAYQWAFLGDPFNIKVINKATGADYQLTVEGTSRAATDYEAYVPNAVLRSGGERNYDWVVYSNTQNSHDDGFVLNLKGTDKYINPYGGSDGYFQIWDNAGARSDANSQLRVAEVPSPEITLNDGGDDYYYATLCMPWEVTVSSGTTAYTIASGEDLSDRYAHLTPLYGGVIPAGTPVVLKGTSGTASLTYVCNNSEKYVLSPLTTTKLTGTLMPTTITSSDYVLGKDAVVGFYHWNQTALGANRAYLTAANGGSVKGFAFSFEDDADGIRSLIPALSEGEGVIYNLAGQRLRKAQKGFNIINGKKILK